MASSLLSFSLRVYSSSPMVKVEVLQLTMAIYLKSYTHSSLYCAINIKKYGKVMGVEWLKQIE